MLRVEVGNDHALQRIPPLAPDGNSVAYLSANAKKSVVQVSPAGARALVARLVAASAVFITDRPEWHSLRAAGTTCHIHPYDGLVEGLCELPTADSIVQAASGAVSVTGHLTGPPVSIGFPIGDVAPGMFATIGILNGLLENEPQHISVRALDATVSLLCYMGCSFMIDGDDVGFIGSGHPYIVPYGAYKAKDGYVIVGAFTQVFWRKLCLMLERADLVENPRFRNFAMRRDNRDELNQIFADLFGESTVADWVSRLKQGDVPHAPVFTMRQAIDQPAVAARDMIVRVNGLALFNSPIVTLAAPDQPGTRPVVSPDWHARLIALGVDAAEIAGFVASGALLPLLTPAARNGTNNAAA